MRITIRTPQDAAPEARERLLAARATSGFIPNLLGVLANAPTALEAYQTVSAIHARSGLDATEREVVQLTAATRNGCGFCVAGHTAVSRKKLRLPDSLLAGLRDIAPLDNPRLDALASFTLAVINSRGQVSDADLARFRVAGYSEANALEVVLGVSLATLCNYANNLAQTPINPELREYADPNLPAYA